MRETMYSIVVERERTRNGVFCRQQLQQIGRTSTVRPGEENISVQEDDGNERGDGHSVRCAVSDNEM